MRRSIYLSIFLVLSAVAGLVYYNQTRQATAVVANHDLTVGSTIADSDVSVQDVSATSISPRVLHTPQQAVGQVVALPILAGEFVDARQLAPTTNARLLSSGLQVPPGYRIIGLPITPAAAVGGTLKAGDAVDVMAISNSQKAGLADPPVGPLMLGKDVLVIGLRNDQGTPIDTSDRGLSAGTNRPATVLLAIPQIDEATYSQAIATSTFVLTLSLDS